jgi:hypothetical protein
MSSQQNFLSGWITLVDNHDLGTGDILNCLLCYLPGHRVKRTEMGQSNHIEKQPYTRNCKCACSIVWKANRIVIRYSFRDFFGPSPFAEGLQPAISWNLPGRVIYAKVCIDSVELVLKFGH